MDITGKEHEFAFTELSAKQLIDIDTTLEGQHEALKENTKCISDGISDDEGEKLVDKLFEDIWKNTGAGTWMENMREIVGNAKKKK